MSGQSTKVRPLEERFWEKVDKRGPNQCWPWTRGRNDKGYGQLRAGAPVRRMILAHRVSYELHKGNVRDGLCVLHECDNPICCNPKHLFLGTHQENMDDRGAKGRSPRGEKQGSAKLTDIEIEEIRRDYRWRSPTHGSTALALKYGVSFGHIIRIVKRQTRKEQTNG